VPEDIDLTGYMQLGVTPDVTYPSHQAPSNNCVETLNRLIRQAILGLVGMSHL
jgi:hypothetical protein